MLLALNNKSERIRATPNSIAICPECEQELISKCGNIKIWHWAHKHNSNCYYSIHPMTEWHYGWQEFALNHGYDIEVRETDSLGVIHRADILGNNRVIELQHSGISQEDIINRCEFYKSKGYRVDWVLDFDKNIRSDIYI